MRIREWSSKKLRLVWLLGVAVECLLVLAAVWVGTANGPAAPSTIQELAARDDSIAKGLLPPPAPVTPEMRANGERLLRDSLGLAVVRKGDTIVAVVPMSPRGDSIVKTAGEAARGLLSTLEIELPLALLMLAATFLPIPLALIVVSIIWWRGRSRSSGVPNTA